jgi:hypothetical protein
MNNKNYLALVSWMMRRDFLEIQRDENGYTSEFEFITAPDPNNYGREIVLGMNPNYHPMHGCEYCGNASGKIDSRGNCVGCGAPLHD